MLGSQENQLLLFAQNVTVPTGISKKPMEIPLTQGKVALVDEENYEWLNQWKWTAKKSGDTFYAVRTFCVNGRKERIDIKMHREILGLTVGDGRIGDHRDRNGLNNQRHNLRVVNKPLNTYNSKTRATNTSGYRGVNWNHVMNKWLARIGKDGTRHHLGYFSDVKNAALAYDNAAIEYYGNDARLNFPKEGK